MFFSRCFLKLELRLYKLTLNAAFVCKVTYYLNMLGYNRIAVSTDVIGTKRGTGMEIENTVFCGHVLSLLSHRVPKDSLAHLVLPELLDRL